MVIHDIENHSEAQRVGLVDKTPAVVRGAVEARGRKQIDPIIAPAKPPREVVDRHDLQHRHA
jgi:hypothetical protein